MNLTNPNIPEICPADRVPHKSRPPKTNPTRNGVVHTHNPRARITTQLARVIGEYSCKEIRSTKPKLI